MIEDVAPLQIASVGLAEQAGVTRLLRRFSDGKVLVGLTGVSLVVNEH